MRNHFHLFFFSENFVIYQEQNLFSRDRLLYFHYVRKELVHAFSCAYIELWMHLGSLESTQGARVAFGYASSNSYASLVLSKLYAQLKVKVICSLKRSFSFEG